MVSRNKHKYSPSPVPLGFAKVSYKFTDVQLTNHLARKKLQQLEETNTEWLKYLEGEIPKRKKKTENYPEKVLVEPESAQPQKNRRPEKSLEVGGNQSLEISQAKTPTLKIKIKKPRAPRKPKLKQQQQQAQQQVVQQAYDGDYGLLLQEHGLAQQPMKEVQDSQEVDFNTLFNTI